MNLSDLRQMVAPYVARGDQFADDLHRLLTIIEQDFGLAPEPPHDPNAGQETDPTATGQARAVAQARAQMQGQGPGFDQTQGPEPVTDRPAEGQTATVEPETATGPVVEGQAQEGGQETPPAAPAA